MRFCEACQRPPEWLNSLKTFPAACEDGRRAGCMLGPRLNKSGGCECGHEEKWHSSEPYPGFSGPGRCRFAGSGERPDVCQCPMFRPVVKNQHLGVELPGGCQDCCTLPYGHPGPCPPCPHMNNTGEARAALKGTA